MEITENMIKCCLITGHDWLNLRRSGQQVQDGPNSPPVSVAFHFLVSEYDVFY